MGLLQGVTELFPVSSLGHWALFPKLFGWTVSFGPIGRRVVLPGLPRRPPTWPPPSPHLVLTRRVGPYRQGPLSNAGTRRIDSADERLACLLVVATVPAGLTGLLVEHTPQAGVRQARGRLGLPHRQRHHPSRRRGVGAAADGRQTALAPRRSSWLPACTSSPISRGLRVRASGRRRGPRAWWLRAAAYLSAGSRRGRCGPSASTAYSPARPRSRWPPEGRRALGPAPAARLQLATFEPVGSGSNVPEVRSGRVSLSARSVRPSRKDEPWPDRRQPRE